MSWMVPAPRPSRQQADRGTEMLMLTTQRHAESAAPRVLIGRGLHRKSISAVTIIEPRRLVKALRARIC